MSVPHAPPDQGGGDFRWVQLQGGQEQPCLIVSAPHTPPEQGGGDFRGAQVHGGHEPSVIVSHTPPDQGGGHFCGAQLKDGQKPILMKQVDKFVQAHQVVLLLCVLISPFFPKEGVTCLSR